MFDIAFSELIIVAVVALVVIGPKDLPKAMRFVGKWVGKARAMSRHFRTGLDTMIREAELEEMEAQWRAQNDAIMKAYPDLNGGGADYGLPGSAPDAGRADSTPAAAIDMPATPIAPAAPMMGMAPPAANPPAANQPATTAPAPAQNTPPNASGGAAA
ncbi:MAG: Sec-independent protein translocase protein TatB [Sphingopyxis sp.]